MFRGFGGTYWLHFQGDNIVHMDAEVIKKKGMFWLYGKVGRNPANRKMNYLHGAETPRRPSTGEQRP